VRWRGRFAVDFGYSNDPTAIIAIYYYNGGYIVDEVVYKKELSNKQIADMILNTSVQPVLTIADSAEPKSIAEIGSYGINIIPCDKGRDSVANGIQVVQGQRMSVTKRSANIIREYRNYLWRNDKDGKVINIPESGFDHTMDAIRYGISSILKDNMIGNMKVFYSE
jgi:phage terminase large subunit